MSTIIFRSITPLYKFSVEQDELSFSGEINNANYSVGLKRYEHDPHIVNLSDEIKLLFPDSERDKITNELLTDAFFSSFDGYILITETRHNSSKELEVAANTWESLYVTVCMLNALEIHSTKGLLYKTTYEYRIPAFGFSRSNSLINRNLLGLLEGTSVLPVNKFSDCHKTFEYLLKKEVQMRWDEGNVFDKIIRLAIQYHNVTFSLVRADHAFLILMIVFEALFKKETEDNISQAAGRIAKLLSSVKADAKKIKGEFLPSENSFEKIRNKIAHGNPSLESEIVKSKYPILYNYVTQAIAALLSIQQEINFTNNYYDEISNYVKTRFDILPNE